MVLYHVYIRIHLGNPGANPGGSETEPIIKRLALLSRWKIFVNKILLGPTRENVNCSKAYLDSYDNKVHG